MTLPLIFKFFFSFWNSHLDMLILLSLLRRKFLSFFFFSYHFVFLFSFWEIFSISTFTLQFFGCVSLIFKILSSLPFSSLISLRISKILIFKHLLRWFNYFYFLEWEFSHFFDFTHLLGKSFLWLFPGKSFYDCLSPCLLYLDTESFTSASQQYPQHLCLQ